jgi:GTPase Era involved in 16S rRNA processing
MESKVCNKCKELLSIDNFRHKKVKTKIYITNDCKKCLYIKNKDRVQKWKNNNKENSIIYFRNYRKENIEKIKNYERKKYPEQNKKYNLDCINNLTDTYVIHKLVRGTNLKHSDIKQYPELIEAKRLQILTKRLCRASQN